MHYGEYKKVMPSLGAKCLALTCAQINVVNSVLFGFGKIPPEHLHKRFRSVPAGIRPNLFFLFLFFPFSYNTLYQLTWKLSLKLC